uniref:Uncharacterized protein n=1 Tax=Anopheles dirus TaxID=7168 RepID=A0A182NI56_9DIPT
MATNGDPSMISPPSSISNGPEPQLPPLPPPLRSTQVLQPLSTVYPGPVINAQADLTSSSSTPGRGVDDGRSSTGTRHSPGSGLKRPRYIGDGTGSLGSRKSDRCDGEDAESLRQLLIE